MTDQLSEEHEAYFRTIFEQFDVNGDKVITKEELRLLMAALGQNLDEDSINELILEIDYDRNGTINCEQFLHLMHIIMKRANPKLQFTKAFRLFDRDGNGSISASELKQVMINLGNDLTDSQVQEIFSWIGLSGSEQMNQQQFVKLLMKNQTQGKNNTS